MSESQAYATALYGRNFSSGESHKNPPPSNPDFGVGASKVKVGKETRKDIFRGGGRDRGISRRSLDGNVDPFLDGSNNIGFETIRDAGVSIDAVAADTDVESNLGDPANGSFENDLSATYSVPMHFSDPYFAASVGQKRNSSFITSSHFELNVVKKGGLKGEEVGRMSPASPSSSSSDFSWVEGQPKFPLYASTPSSPVKCDRSNNVSAFSGHDAVGSGGGINGVVGFETTGTSSENICKYEHQLVSSTRTSEMLLKSVGFFQRNEDSSIISGEYLGLAGDREGVAWPGQSFATHVPSPSVTAATASSTVGQGGFSDSFQQDASFLATKFEERMERWRNLAERGEELRRQHGYLQAMMSQHVVPPLEADMRRRVIMMSSVVQESKNTVDSRPSLAVTQPVGLNAEKKSNIRSIVREATATPKQFLVGSARGLTRTELREKIERYITRKIEMQGEQRYREEKKSLTAVRTLSTWLESRLYRSNSNIGLQYISDPLTVERFVNLSLAGLAYRLHRCRCSGKWNNCFLETSAKGSAEQMRDNLLREKLGESTLCSVKNTVEEVQRIRRMDTAWARFDTRKFQGLKAKDVLPLPLANIYFDVRLVDEYRFLLGKQWRGAAPAGGSGGDRNLGPSKVAEIVVNKQYWEHMLKMARKVLRSYRRLEIEVLTVEAEEVQESSGEIDETDLCTWNYFVDESTRAA